MILRSKKCIFVHIPKVAGQSIETALRSVASGVDGTRADMGLRKRNRGEPGPERLAHLTSLEYSKLGFVSSEDFRDYYKFAFVRNPWDRAHSMYRHFGLDKHLTFEYFLEYVLKREMWREKYWFVRPQCDFVLDAHGGLCIDFVGRFETLEEDFQHIAGILELKIDSLPHVNRADFQPRGQRLRALRRYPRIFRHWRGMFHPRAGDGQRQFSAEAMGIIEELYQCDMERFGYSPEQGSSSGSAEYSD